MKNMNTLQRLAVASTFALSIVSAGVAASAQTTAAPVATVPVTTTGNVGSNVQAANATTVTMSTIVSQPDRKADLERDTADERRIAFRHQGFNL